MTIVLFGERETEASGASVEGGDLWLDEAEFARATGWELKPEGLCRKEVCVPLPPGREAEIARAGRVNLSAFARLLDLAAVHDEEKAVWAFADTPVGSSAAVSGEAPDFVLPDLDSRLHRLSDYRGAKVLLASWASW